MAGKLVKTISMRPITLIEDLAYRIPVDLLIDVSPRVRQEAAGWSLVWEDKANSNGQALANALSLGDGQTTPMRYELGWETATRTPGQAAIDCMVSRDWSSGASAPRVWGQSLAVMTEMSDARLAQLLGGLKGHATTVRAARYEFEVSSVTLMLLRNDLERGSSLRSFLQTSVANGAMILWPYQSDIGLVFAAEAPDRVALAAVSELLQESPELFNLEPIDNSILHIDAPALLIHDGRPHDLRNTSFFGPSAFEPERTLPAVQPIVAASDRALAARKLKQQLSRSSEAFTSRVRLVENKRPPDRRVQHGRLVKLRRDRARIEREIAILDADLGSRFQVLIAEDSAFDAVAEALRRIHVAEGKWYGTHYGYARLQPDDEPVHILLFPPSAGAAIAGLDDLVAGLARENLRTRLYEADPTWQLKYSDRAITPILVPMRRAIGQLPHSWESDQMDRFLMETLQDLEGTATPRDLGSVAAILFDVDAIGPDDVAVERTEARIFMRVLPQEILQPLSGEVISWLNDVSLVKTRQADRAPVLAMAAAEREADLAARADELHRAASEAITQSRKKALAQLERKLSNVVANVTKQVESLTQAAQNNSEQLRDIEATTHTSLEAYRKAKTAAAEIATAFQILDEHAQASSTASVATSNRVTSTISEIENRFHRDDARAKAVVDRMETRIAALRRRIKDLFL